MKTVIAYKWARDGAHAAVREDGSVDWRSAKMTAGEDDPAALSTAKAIAAATGGDLVGLTLGDGDASWVLARGVEQSVSVTDAPNLADNAQTAAILAAGVRAIGNVDVVVVGDCEQYPGVPVALAGLLGWPAVVGIDSATARDGRLEIVRKVGDDHQILSLATPAVLGVAALSAEDSAPGMKELLAARKRPLTKLTLADLGITVADSVSSRGSHLPATKPVRVFDGDPTLAAQQLVGALRADGAL